MEAIKTRSSNINLTPGLIRGAVCPEGKQQIILRDARQPGLGLRVTAGGSKVYIFQGKLAGQVVRMTLGDTKTLTLEAARDKAAELRVMIRTGRDPRVVKAERTAADAAKRQKAAAECEPALVAWEEYLRVRGKSKWSPRTLLDHERLGTAGGRPKARGRKQGEGDTTQAGPLYGLLQKPLAKIDATVVLAWLEENQHRPTVARFAYVRLRAFVRWCADRPAYRDYVSLDAFASKAVRETVPAARVKTDGLERQHLQAWFVAVRRLPPVPAAYLQTCLLTGARRSEIAALKWSDLDFRWNTIHLVGKTGERMVPMTPYCKALLLNLRRSNVVSLDGARAPQSSPFVFAAASACGHIAEPRIAHNRALAQAGLPALTIHGLRRSFGTLSEWVEAPAGVVAQIMGHRPSAIAEKHYRQRPLDLLRMWHVKIEGWILAQAGIEQPAIESRAARAS